MQAFITGSGIFDDVERLGCIFDTAMTLQCFTTSARWIGHKITQKRTCLWYSILYYVICFWIISYYCIYNIISYYITVYHFDFLHFITPYCITYYLLLFVDGIWYSIRWYYVRWYAITWNIYIFDCIFWIYYVLHFASTMFSNVAANVVYCTFYFIHWYVGVIHCILHRGIERIECMFNDMGQNFLCYIMQI